MMASLRAFFIISLHFLALGLGFSCSVARAAESSFSGYITDVQTEREQRFYEIYIFTTPPPAKANLKDTIFNPQLSKEFRDKYRETFGQVDTDSIVYQHSDFNALDQNRGVVQQTEAQYQDRRNFANYMMKRLVEWHVDNYFKTDPTMRPVYELKDKLSHVEVTVAQEVKVNAQYNLSGNTLDVVAKNPYLDESKLSLEMNPTAFGPASVIETRIRLGNNVSKTVRYNFSATLTDGIATLERVKQLGAWALSNSVSMFFKQGGTSTREGRLMTGISRAF